MNQLQTLNDPSIYQGNSLLCGPPLSSFNNMPGGRTWSWSKTKWNKKEWWKGIWVIIVLHYFGSWLYCWLLGSLWHIVVKTSWRQAYFQTFDNLKDKIFIFIKVKVARLSRERWSWRKIQDKEGLLSTYFFWCCWCWCCFFFFFWLFIILLLCTIFKCSNLYLLEW